MAQPIITVVGTVATPPDLQTTNRGTPYAAFRLAQTERRFNPRTNRWEDGTTSWYSVTCWRSWGENVAQSLRVGDPVVVSGRLKVRDFKVEGEARRQAEIDAVTVGHDIRRGVSNFTKVTRPAADFVDEDDEVSAHHNRLAQQHASNPWSEPAGEPDVGGEQRTGSGDGEPPSEQDTGYGLSTPFGSSATDEQVDTEKQAA
jgi:single-strand DNA-binding protein